MPTSPETRIPEITTPETTITGFTAGDLVVSISGDGDGSGTYTDNQASPITLEEFTTGGSVVGQFVLPQTATVVNGTTEQAISGEYGSSSEGQLQLSADGRSLVIAGYGVNAATYNAGGAAVYGNAALAQSTSLTGSTSFTPVARVIADIDVDGSVDTSTALFNVFNTNNPRSVATVDGTSFFVAGQGVKGDATQGVFLAHDGAGGATAIDTSTDARVVSIVNGQLFVSKDSTQGTGGTSEIGTYGTAEPVSATTATVLPNIAGSVTLTAARENSVNAGAVGSTVHLSPEAYFFANATTLYVADGGNPKEGGIGDGGLQKWTFDGTDWNLQYTLSTGLNLVADTGTSGTTGLIGLTGVVNGSSVTLYATNSTIGDTDQTFLYSITDTLGATGAAAGEAFSTVLTAAPDTNIRGIAFAPTAAAAAPVATVVSGGGTTSGVTVTSGGSITVQSGGVASNTTVLSGGTDTVAAGGSEFGTSLAHGATESLSGSATGDQVDGTQTAAAGTAAINGETVYDGGVVDLYVKGATAGGLVLTNGGTLNISGAATATNTTISGGGLIDLQSAKATLAGSVSFAGSGTLEVTSSLSSAGAGDQAVISGFGAGDAVDVAVIGGGATLSTGVVGGNTLATVTSGAASESFTFAGAVGSSLSLAADGNGGEEIVYAAAPAGSNTVVGSGGSLTGFTVSGGNTLTVQSGGSVTSATVLSGGLATISGTDTDSVISAGGNEVVSGAVTGDQVRGTQVLGFGTATASGETVFGGGTLDLFLKGAVATGTVLSGGTLNISGNATATNTTLGSGALLDLQSPKAVVAGALLFSGAATLEETAVVSAGFGVSATISGFAGGDVVDLAAVNATGATLTATTSGGNTVETVSSGGVSQAFTFAGTAIGTQLALGSDAAGGAEIVYACFAEGTLIAVPGGEVAVERLTPGMPVTTPGGPRPVTWVGHRSVVLSRLPNPETALLVRVVRDAFGPGRPHRDLLVTQEHCIHVDGVLIPARMLVNDRSVRLDRSIGAYTYHHVELERHAILFAEGLETESYLDTGNRGGFSNVATAVLLPGLSFDAAHPGWANAAAPLAVDRGRVEPVWRALEARALRLGLARDRTPTPLTNGPRLRCVIADGTELEPSDDRRGRHVFDLPAGYTGPVRLMSRRFSPADVTGPFVDDRRRLGVKVGGVELWRGLQPETLTAHLSTTARDGWWPAEGDGSWTDGDARLLIEAASGDGEPTTLMVRVVAGGPYRCEAEAPSEGTALAG